MTVPVPDQLEYISDADGTTTDFPYPKRFLQSDEIIVVLRDADGVDTPQILGTHYTIAGSSWPTGGMVSFITAPQVPNKVVRFRMTEAKQTVSLNNLTRNDAPSVELQLDRMTMAIQDRGSFLTRIRDWLSSTVIALRVERAERIAGDANLNGRVDQEIVDRENGDKAVASLIGQAGSVEVPLYDTRLALSMARVKPTINVVQVGGITEPGAMPVISYKRVPANPGWGERVQSLDGSWWQEVKREISKGEATAAEYPEGTQEIRTTWDQYPGDGRGAVYEAGVLNPEWFSADLRILKNGRWFVNQRGWQKCVGKRFGRIVIYGSSTMAGMGTSDFVYPSLENGWTESPNSWVGRLRAALGGEAEIINRSYPGENSTRGIDDFKRKVAPYSPDTVIIGFGWVNEGTSGTQARKAADVYNRLLRLCSLCWAIGAKPIVMITMAGDASLIHTYGIAKALRQRGITIWDISACVKDRSSNAISADYAADTTHANDAGHLRYFQNININDLLVDIRGETGQPVTPILGKDGYYIIGAEPTTIADPAPLQVVFTGDFRPLDICVASRMYATKVSGNSPTVMLYIQPLNSSDNPQMSVRPSGSVWALWAGNTVVLTSAVTWDRQAVHRSAISYDRGRNRFDWYQDGEFVGSYTPDTAPTTTAGWAWARCGGDGATARWGAGWHIQDFVVMRNPALNGFGVRAFGDRSIELAMPLPCTMGARFPLTSLADSSGMVSNIEDDMSSRLTINAAYARLYDLPIT